MAIPETGPFENTLRNLSLHPPENRAGWLSEVAVPQAALTEAQPTLKQFEEQTGFAGLTIPAVRLWFPTSSPVSFQSLVKRLEAEIRGRNHPSTPEIAKALLAAFVEVRGIAGSAVRRLNRLLDCIHPVDVYQFYALPGDSLPDYHLELPPFTIGQLSWERLARRSEEAGSDFHRRYERRMQNRFGIERAAFQTHIVDWMAVQERVLTRAESSLLRPGTPGYHLTDEYHFLVARALASNFWDTLLGVQHILLAAGAPYLDERALRDLPCTQLVTIFLRRPPRIHGWVSPALQAQLVFELSHSDQRIQLVRERLERDFGYTSSGREQVHRTIDTYSLFVSRAVRHDVDGRRDEAFLHFVIALDLLLGGEEESAKSVSHRAAALVCRPLEADWDTTVKRIKAMYAARSKYVHEGKTVSEEQVSLAKQICELVLFALLRVHRRSAARHQGFVQQWLKDLDFVAAHLDAGREVAGTDWLAIGVDDVTASGPDKPAL